MKIILAVSKELPIFLSYGINKTTKAQSKYEKGSPKFNRFEPIIRAMLISKAFIESQINIDWYYDKFHL